MVKYTSYVGKPRRKCYDDNTLSYFGNNNEHQRFISLHLSYKEFCNASLPEQWQNGRNEAYDISKWIYFC